MLTLYQPCFNVVQRCFDVVSMSGDVVSTSVIDVVSTLYNVENPMSNFVSFSTLDQLKQREPTPNYSLSIELIESHVVKNASVERDMIVQNQ